MQQQQQQQPSLFSPGVLYFPFLFIRNSVSLYLYDACLGELSHYSILLLENFVSFLITVLHLCLMELWKYQKTFYNYLG